MKKTVNSLNVARPLANYSHSVLVEAGTELLFCSGQLGVEPDGEIPPDAAEQARLCFRNIAALLREAGMEKSDVVRFNAYVADGAYLSDYMQERDLFLEGEEPPPASTVMVVSGFAREEFKIEIEAIAARKPR